MKLRFLAGLAHRITEVNGTIGMPQVRETLGQLAAEVGMVEGLLLGMEAKGARWGEHYVPDRALLYSAQVLTQQLYPRFIDRLRDLAGGGLIMLPSSEADLRDPATAADIARTQGSADAAPFERVQFFKLAWDAIGSEFASRTCSMRSSMPGRISSRAAMRSARSTGDAGRRMVDAMLARSPPPSGRP